MLTFLFVFGQGTNFVCIFCRLFVKCLILPSAHPTYPHHPQMKQNATGHLKCPGDSLQGKPKGNRSEKGSVRSSGGGMGDKYLAGCKTLRQKSFADLQIEAAVVFRFIFLSIKCCVQINFTMKHKTNSTEESRRLWFKRGGTTLQGPPSRPL